MFFKLGNPEDRYHELLTALDDADFDVYMESLSNIRTKWVESGGKACVTSLHHNIRRNQCWKDLMQEIHAWLKKNGGMLYFPCLMSALCKKHGVKTRGTNEICNPQAPLVKPKGHRRQAEAGHVSTRAEFIFETDNVLWSVLLQT
ncbi:unnamed protein product [Vicia faba]|uniref:Uncharacterized protein n=1 Tax=Vicia faba TaxID=3906 RepID=A0AAV1AXG6_VICFA|nr:unnamed protein product [Vicia faba]